MNIFVLDMDHKTNCQYYIDKHIVKMITEHAQLLSSACRMNNIDAGYRLTHKNHPCAIWARASLTNWLWLRDLTKYMNDEYRFRYSRDVNHKSFDVAESLPVPDIEDLGLTKFALAMPEQYKTSDVVESYRNYYIGEKKNIATYKNRVAPEWLNV